MGGTKTASSQSVHDINRFRFCGDQDCPDWALAEIATLSKISLSEMKLLCLQVVKDMFGNEFDYNKINQLTSSEAKYTAGDVKGSIAALQFIFASSAKHSVDEESLSREIQQLGLPKEHTSTLCKLYVENCKELHEVLRSKTLRLSRLEDIQWRVDYILGSSHLKDADSPMTTLNLKVGKSEEATHSFTLTPEKLRVLLFEMKQLHSLMEGI